MSMCVQSDKPTRMLFIYNRVPVAPCKYIPPPQPPPSYATELRSAPGNLVHFERNEIKDTLCVCRWHVAPPTYQTTPCTLNFVVLQMSTGLMSVHNGAPQKMNTRLWQSASNGQRPGSRNSPLTSLISAFIFPPPSKFPQQHGARWLLRAIVWLHACAACTAQHKPLHWTRMSGGGGFNKQLHRT